KRWCVAAALAAVCGWTAGAQRADVADPALAKLTTVLADLSRSVAQDQGAAPSPASASAKLAVESLPASVRDAMQGRLLPINDKTEVQVYILLDDVSDATIGRLSAAGAIIEIKDPDRRRVQARVPVSRLQAVAGLSVVSAIRLPTYARHRSGRVTTEGDPILHADAVRQQLAVDGTGVRVGVVSDGLKGVFATGCTTNCGGVSGGPMETGDLPVSAGTRNA